MKKLLFSSISAVAFIASASAQQTDVAVGTFDPAGSSTINAYAGSLTSADLTAWKSTVSTAFTNGTGGVFNSLDSAGSVTIGNPGFPASSTQWNVSFGTNKVFGITASVAHNSDAYATSDELSGSRSFMPAAAVGTYTLTFNLSGSGLAANERITSLGLGLLGRSSTTSTVTLTVIFDDNTTSALTAPANLAQGTNAFFRWDAPSGRYITQLSYSSTNASRLNPIDDLSFTTTAIPEPSAFAALAGLGALGMAALRRRRRSIG